MAARLKVGITLHASEQVHEFHEILRRTMRTPIGWLEDEGFLGPEVILGHCIYVSGHRFTSYPFKGDLEAIAASGASVAHSPVALARRGVTLDSFQRYREHGINLAIGTDSYPQDILAEMRWASLTCKVTERNNEFGERGGGVRCGDHRRGEGAPARRSRPARSSAPKPTSC